MFHRNETILRNGTGLAIFGATVTVYVNGTDTAGDYAAATKATLYSANEAILANETANPVSTDVNGEYGFYIADGIYDEVVKYGSITEVQTYIQMVDLFDANTESEQARDDAIAAKDEAVAAAASATESKVASAASETNSAASASDSAGSADTAGGARDEAVAASLTAIANANASETSRSNAADSETNAAASAASIAITKVATRALLAAAAIANVALLTEAGREGTFVWSAANLQAQVTADTQQGLYVPPTGGNGSTGAWVRKFPAGQADFRWFGGVADMTADGVGTNNTPMFDAARAALIAAGHSWLHLVQQTAAYRFSTAPAAIHDGLLLTGERHYSNPGQVGATTYVGIQIFNGTALGFAADVPGFKLVAYTDNASNALAFEYQSSNGSAIRDLVMYSEGGGGTTSHGIESFVKTDLDNLRVTGFAGTGVKLSGDDSGTANQYGNPITSNIRNVYSLSNKLHGFHVTGNNGNVIKFDDCAAQLNGGVGFLDQGFLGNAYTSCLAATNNASFGTPAGFSAAQRTQVTTDYAGLATHANGSFVCIGGSATSVFTACYAEVGNGQYPDLSSQCVVNGGILANTAWQFNVGTSGNPTINSGRGVDTPQLNFTKNQANSVVAFDNAKIYRHADRGLVIQGAPAAIGTYDVTIVNKNDTPVMGVATGGTLSRFFGEVSIDTANFRLNGNSVFPGLIATAARFWTTAVNGLMMAGFGTTYDTCLANQVGTVALRVPANTTNVQVVGTVTGSNLSGTNTGDQTSIVGITGTIAQFNTAITDADIVPTGLATASGLTIGTGKLLGRTTAATGAIEEIATSGGLTLTAGVLGVGALTPSSVAATGDIATSGGKVGYATGSGGTVTQATSKSTAVTLNKSCGQVTMNAAALATVTAVAFTVNNSQVAATDTIDLCLQSGNATAGTYNYQVDKVSAGSFVIWVKNISGGSLSESLVFNFTVNKGVSA